MGNPITEAIDLTLTSVPGDPKRTLGGFIEMADKSVEWQRLHRTMLVTALETEQVFHARIYSIVAYAFQMGFESGKNYAISGGFEKMMALEDQWNREHPQTKE